jgi:histidinol-phosphatase
MYEAEVAFARGLADAATDIGLSVFRGDVRVTIKADRTPVTQADTEIETMVRERVAAAFPDDRVLGEEEGGDAAAPGRVWIIDPIDATANFARGIPIWGTLIALQVDGELVLGLANAPALDERYEARRGGGAICNDESIHVSDVAAIPEAQLLFSGIGPWIRSPSDKGVLGVLAEAKRTRGFGDFWAHMLVARGAAEATMEPELAIWDYAALAVIVQEAGGRMTTLEGGPVHHGGSVLTSNGSIHDELVRRFAGS